LVLLSYSCGSALGSVTTLCTLTFPPPSWVTRLPQKFSPATTSMLDAAVEVVPAQAASSSTPITGASHLPTRKSFAQVVCASQVRVSLTAMARPSPVSDQVRTLFEAEQKHLWSIDELHEAVVQSLGAADYSTVFRAVTGMEKEGAIKRIDLGDGKVHYEMSEDHHEHIRCDSCGRVVEVPGCVLEDAERSVKSSTGFVVTSHQLLFTGVCPDCSVKAARR